MSLVLTVCLEFSRDREMGRVDAVNGFPAFFFNGRKINQKQNFVF